MEEKKKPTLSIRYRCSEGGGGGEAGGTKGEGGSIKILSKNGHGGVRAGVERFSSREREEEKNPPRYKERRTANL